MANNFKTRMHDGDCQLSTKYFLRMDADDKKSIISQVQREELQFCITVLESGAKEGKLLCEQGNFKPFRNLTVTVFFFSFFFSLFCSQAALSRFPYCVND